MITPRSSTSARSATDSARSICCSTIEHRDAVTRPVLEELEDRRNQRLGEPERGLVAQQHRGTRDERLRQRQHLLLAAGQIARRGAQLRTQDRKEIEHRLRERLELAALRVDGGAQADVVGDGELGKHAMTIEDQPQALARIDARASAR